MRKRKSGGWRESFAGKAAWVSDYALVFFAISNQEVLRFREVMAMDLVTADFIYFVRENGKPGISGNACKVFISGIRSRYWSVLSQGKKRMLLSGWRY